MPNHAQMCRIATKKQKHAQQSPTKHKRAQQTKKGQNEPQKNKNMLTIFYTANSVNVLPSAISNVVDPLGRAGETLKEAALIDEPCPTASGC